MHLPNLATPKANVIRYVVLDSQEGGSPRREEFTAEDNTFGPFSTY